MVSGIPGKKQCILVDEEINVSMESYMTNTINSTDISKEQIFLEESITEYKL